MFGRGHAQSSAEVQTAVKHINDTPRTHKQFPLPCSCILQIFGHELEPKKVKIARGKHMKQPTDRVDFHLQPSYHTSHLDANTQRSREQRLFVAKASTKMPGCKEALGSASITKPPNAATVETIE